MQRTERLGVVLSKREKRIVLRLAEAEGGLSQAALIRRLIRQEARAKGLWQVSIREEATDCRGRVA